MQLGLHFAQACLLKHLSFIYCLIPKYLLPLKMCPYYLACWVKNQGGHTDFVVDPFGAGVGIRVDIGITLSCMHNNILYFLPNSHGYVIGT